MNNGHERSDGGPGDERPVLLAAKAGRPGRSLRVLGITVAVLLTLLTIGMAGAVFGARAVVFADALLAYRWILQGIQFALVAALWWQWEPLLSYVARRSGRHDAQPVPELLQARHRICGVLFVAVLIGVLVV